MHRPRTPADEPSLEPPGQEEPQRAFASHRPRHVVVPGSTPRGSTDTEIWVDATRQKSPLRHSVSYTDPAFGPAATMPLTGDGRQAAEPRTRTPTAPRGGRSPNSAQTANDFPTSLRRPQLSPRVSTPASTSRFAFFTSLTGLSSPSPTAPQEGEDELFNLDIESALFPPNSPLDRDPFSPAAFMNLQMTASGLLNKFQTAYRHRTTAVKELTCEREAQVDEKGEADTKVQHLKLQLEGMAHKAAEQEAAMQALMAELNREKKLRVEEQQGRRAFPSEESVASEDLGAEDDQERGSWRKSGGTATDTDEESVEEASVFTRSRSSTNAPSVSEISPVEAPPVPVIKAATLNPPRPAPRGPQPQQLSTFQRLFKGAGAAEDPRGSNACRNCQGQEASVAWDTVGLLRDENRGLKLRVGALEEAVEGALDVVNGIGL